ncbi:hypothetical protein APHAL10511_006651 [Amanita phalloides]|nr:hypothetical protein APHAL10511_006651 [Amanita phalloides]
MVAAYLTPGLRFLSKRAGYLAIIVIAIIAIRHLVDNLFDVRTPTWTIIPGSLLTPLLVIHLRITWKGWKDRRDAAALGAQVVPKVKGKRFGNLDIVKNLLEVWVSGYPGDYLEDLFDSLGSVFNVYFVYEDLLFTISPEHIKLIVATSFQNFVKGERFQYAMHSVLGTGVFNSDGDMWKFHRSMSRPAFVRARISDYEIFDRHANAAISLLKQRLREGYAIDFQDLVSRFTLDTATEFLFANCLHSLSAGLPYPHNVTPPSCLSFDTNRTTFANAFAVAFLEAQDVAAERERHGWVWPFYEIWKDRTYKSMQIIDGCIEPIIREALAKKKASAHKGNVNAKMSEHLEDGETLLSHLVQVTEDPKVLKDAILNIMIAGRDTTASTLTFTLYFLALHPQVTTRLRQEILENVGSTRMPDPDNIRDMKYLRAVINETLRLFPPVPFNVRTSVNAMIWPNPDPTQKPYYIPAGTRCAYSVIMMHRRKDLWGPDALEFDPDRFLDDRYKEYTLKNPFIFLPFNAGPRICLGQQFAYNEMSIMLIRLLQSFSSVALDPTSAPLGSLPPGGWKTAAGRKAVEKIMPKIHITMYSNGGLWVKMEEATEGSH